MAQYLDELKKMDGIILDLLKQNISNKKDTYIINFIKQIWKTTDKKYDKTTVRDAILFTATKGLIVIKTSSPKQLVIELPKSG